MRSEPTSKYGATYTGLRNRSTGCQSGHFFLLLLAIACGCASPRPGLTLAHTIEIPKQWRAGSESPSSTDIGSAERYANAYDRGWWIMVGRYVKDIDFADPSPLAMSGWAAEAAGGQNGYVAARDRIEELIRGYGKPRVSAYLQQFRQPEEN